MLATAGYDHTIRLWEVATGVAYRTIQFTDSQVNALRFSPDRLYLAAAGNPRVVLFDVTSANPNPFMVCDAHKGNVTSIQFEQMGGGQWLVSASEDGTIKVWDTRVNGVKRSFAGLNNTGNVGGDGVTEIFLLKDQKRLVSVDFGGRMRLWDVGSGEIITEVIMPGAESLLTCSMNAENSTSIACCSKLGKVFVYDLKSQVVTAALNPNSGPASPTPTGPSSMVSPRANGDQAAAMPSTPGRSKTSFSFLAVTNFVAHHRYVLKSAWSPDGQTLATALDDGTIKLWTPNGSQEQPSSNAVGQANASPTPASPRSSMNNSLISADSTTNGASNTMFALTRTLGAHQRWVWDIAFTPDSMHMFSASSDKKALLWDMNSGAVVREYVGHQKALTCLAITNDEQSSIVG